MFKLLEPYETLSPRHPLFKLEPERLRRRLTPTNLVRASRKLMLSVVVVLFVFWLLFAVLNSTRSTFGIYSSNMLVFLLIISIGADVILDFACMVYTANSFAGEITAGRWELLRLTLLEPEHLVEYKYMVAELRVWRLMIGVISIRLAAVLLTIASGLWGWILWGIGYIDLPNFVGVISIFAVMVIVYLLEPRWRVQAVTAFGLVISSRVRSTVSLTLTALGTVLGLWIVQAIIMGILAWVTISFLSSMYYSVWGAYFCVCSSALVTAGVIYGFYHSMRTISLARAVEQSRRLEQ